MDLNKAQIIGRLTADPELRTTPSGASVASFSVATNFNWTNQSGEKQEQVEYHNVVAWRRLGEIAAQYLKKGRRVFIEGRLQTRSWVAQDGAKRYRTEIVADNMIMLDGPRGEQAVGSSDIAEQPAPKDEVPTIDVADDIKPEDIPF